MKEITVPVTEQQEQFLKLFAANHYPGARDNLATDQPLHIVQTKSYQYLLYAPGTEDSYHGLILVFGSDGESEWTTDETAVVREYYGEKTPPFPIKSFDELKWEAIESPDPDWDGALITNYTEYFEAYGVPNVNIAWQVETYKNVAYFFILEEARKYLKYQAHNLNEPRTYTVCAGYANQGEYHHFYELLHNIGQSLLKEDAGHGGV